VGFLISVGSSKEAPILFLCLGDAGLFPYFENNHSQVLSVKDSLFECEVYRPRYWLKNNRETFGLTVKGGSMGRKKGKGKNGDDGTTCPFCRKRKKAKREVACKVCKRQGRHLKK